MADDRVLPPTPRRVALARRAGLVARSPILVAGAAWAGAVIGLWLAATRARDLLAAAIRAGSAGSDTAAPGALAPADIAGAVLGLVAPLVIGAACGALALHLAQTRTLAIPRRAIEGAPRPAHGVDRRAGDAGLRAVRAALVAATALGWTWVHLGDLGGLADLAPAAALAATGVLAVSAFAHLAAALLVAGALDLGVAVLRHRADLRMTRREATDDARAAGLDPRWRDQRARAGRDPLTAVATARLVVTGAGAAAIRYHERLWPRPIVVAAGRGLDATRLIELARRHRVPIHHAPALARALAAAGADAAVPEPLLAPLAELIAADDGA